eukprot:GHRR01029235.1.p1 GENE.GHRR01029235.1~~GHRR01029235.1.p1  ORF type:complete len:288 (+),score=88.81 GHRR01029235.1:342-1205(+)
MSGSSTISASNAQRDPSALPPPPYKVTYPTEQQQLQPAPGSTKRGADADAAADGTPGSNPAAAAADGGTSGKPVLLVEHYRPVNMGPYPEDKPKGNEVRFTPVQVEAVGAGVQPGLTMIVGPPGTGKTDTAVQILQVLYYNCPGQRTLLITHSNQALNDLFAKMVARDIPARYLLRLGMGERDLDVDDDFSRAGRVNNMLARRLTLLAEVGVAREYLLRMNMGTITAGAMGSVGQGVLMTCYARCCQSQQQVAVEGLCMIRLSPELSNTIAGPHISCKASPILAVSL